MWANETHLHVIEVSFGLLTRGAADLLVEAPSGPPDEVPNAVARQHSLIVDDRDVVAELRRFFAKLVSQRAVVNHLEINGILGKLLNGLERDGCRRQAERREILE